uniref:Replication-associated protein n=1 Tax=Syrmaticus ellioti CRESS-DNA-virus sp. TaxID=2815058 RepID=A0A8A4XB65_9VIRU|nr:MAG: replication-associated protein [Syrmaticus ellioti CRESS-DNA-virus sp.]
MEQAQGTSTRGNTRSTGVKRRNYMITFWNKDYPKELPKQATYMCTCEDSTKDGRYHGHAFIYFKNPCTMKAVKKLFGDDCHVERPMKNSDCIEYVLDTTKRKHTFQEFGKRPMDNGIHNMKELLAMEPEDVNPLYYNVYTKAKAEQANDIDIDEWHKDVKVIYIYGPSGVGKTERAKQIVREHKNEYGTKINVVKYENGFWSGVGNAKIAIYDDFRDSHMKPSEFINFIDYNIHTLNIKGGQRQNKYELIIITSVQSLEHIYRNVCNEPRKQWMRRIEPIQLGEPDNDVVVDKFDGYFDDQ